ncbi:MAG TPA: type II toxin-antitoxin system VapC family toxin [Candidatus Nanoarchaeia archaeon]|nr:type II toxin-antitoxin system VapC family toxin [Candidatus Nanoarchaeia archaeon]
MYFVDANVLTQAFTENPNQENCRKILFSECVTNTLCLIEAFSIIYLIKKDKIYATNCIKSLFKTNCIIVDLDRNLLFESFKRMDKTHLDIFDLIHYTTALINNCSEFVSYDKDFDGLEIKRIEP